jgi:hypothetical protein
VRPPRTAWFGHPLAFTAWFGFTAPSEADHASCHQHDEHCRAVSGENQTDARDANAGNDDPTRPRQSAPASLSANELVIGTLRLLLSSLRHGHERIVP